MGVLLDHLLETERFSELKRKECIDKDYVYYKEREHAFKIIIYKEIKKNYHAKIYILLEKITMKIMI